MDQPARYSVLEKSRLKRSILQQNQLLRVNDNFGGISRQKFSNQSHNKAPLGQIEGDGIEVYRTTLTRSGRPQSVRTENHTVIVKQCLEQSPRKSTRRFFLESDLSSSSVVCIMHQDLHMFKLNLTYIFYNFRLMQTSLRDVPSSKL